MLKELDEVKKAHANQLKSIALIKKELEDHKAAAPSVKPTLSESEQVDALQQKFEKAEAANVSVSYQLFLKKFKSIFFRLMKNSDQLQRNWAK